MDHHSMERTAFIIAVIAIIGVGLWLNANYQQSTRSNAFVVGGSALACPLVKHFAGKGVVEATSCEDQAAITQASTEAWQECIDHANAYQCPSWCSTKSIGYADSVPLDPDTAATYDFLHTPLTTPVYPCDTWPDGSIHVTAFAFCDVLCKGRLLINPPTVIQVKPASIAPEKK